MVVHAANGDAVDGTLGGLRIPIVCLTWANSLFLAFFALNKINALRAFNVIFSSNLSSRPHMLYSAQDRP
jgi:hypothetical protein